MQMLQISDISYQIYESLCQHQLLLGITNVADTTLLTSQINTSQRFAFNYQYLSQARKLDIHTTLGFISRHQNSLLGQDQLIDDIVSHPYQHDFICLTSLNSFCMTPIEDITTIIRL